MDKKLTYPFEFDAIPINDGVLDALGFGEYQDLNGDCGVRRIHLTLGFYEIGEHLERRDGYGPEIDASGNREALGFVAHHYSLGPYMRDLFFLHELVNNVLENKRTEFTNEFFKALYKANMMKYVDSYLKYTSKLKILVEKS